MWFGCAISVCVCVCVFLYVHVCVYGRGFAWEKVRHFIFNILFLAVKKRRMTKDPTLR